MKLGLYMATQWRQGADLGPELANLLEQVRVAKASGLGSLMVGQHFGSTPLQMFPAIALLAPLAAAADFPGDAFARPPRRRGRGHAAGAGAAAAAAAQSGDRGRGVRDVRLD